VRIRRLSSILVAAILAVTSLGLLGAGAASAAPAGHGAGTWVCSGTPKSPGVLAGSHSSVVVIGTCVVNAGPASVQGNLVVTRDSTLLAAFARNDTTHHGKSRLAVGGNLVVRAGGTLLLGCEAAHFACLDDPHQKHPTLSSASAVGGNLIGTGALGIVVHNSAIGGSVLQNGGGPGLTCTPTGVFAQFKSPVYSDYEDNWIGGSLAVAGLRSCWLGSLRNHVHGSVLMLGNRLADPDAMEVVSNVVRGNMACFRNHPAVQFGDSRGVSNVVGHFAFGQCGFRVLKPNPAPTKTTPAGPLEHISIPARAVR
jgi:hypothetical protein